MLWLESGMKILADTRQTGSVQGAEGQLLE